MDFAALQRLSEEEGSLEKAEQQENKENTPPSRGKNSDKHSNSAKRSAQAQTLSVTQYSPRQSLSIRVPKAKVDRSTQVSASHMRVLRSIHNKRTQKLKQIFSWTFFFVDFKSFL